MTIITFPLLRATHLLPHQKICLGTIYYPSKFGCKMTSRRRYAKDQDLDLTLRVTLVQCITLKFSGESQLLSERTETIFNEMT